MCGYYTTALMAVFLLSEGTRAVASAQALTGYMVKTTNSLHRLAECGRMEQLQIVDSVYGQQKKPLPTSDVIAIYNAADELIGFMASDREAATKRAKEKLRQIEDALGEIITVSYICVSGLVDAVTPCHYSGNMEWTGKASVMFRNDVHPACSRRCILTSSRPTSTHDIVWNVLVNQPQSSSFKVVYSTNDGNDWQCLDPGFHNLSTSVTTLLLRFSWKGMLNLTRLWLSFDGVPFRIACDNDKAHIVPTCSRKSTMSVATTTTSKSVAATPVSSNTICTPQRAQSDHLKQMITVMVVLSAASVVIVFILIAVVVYPVKKQSQDPVRPTNPGTNQSVAVTSA